MMFLLRDQASHYNSECFVSTPARSRQALLSRPFVQLILLLQRIKNVSLVVFLCHVFAERGRQLIMTGQGWPTASSCVSRDILLSVLDEISHP